MNLPNKLTVSRIILVPFVLIFMLPLPLEAALLWNGFAVWNAFVLCYGMIPALLLFIVASLTDYYDGKLARQHNMVSNFGKFLDPIADKLLVLSITIALVQIGKIHAIVPIIFLFRDFVVTGVRLLGAEQNEVIAASHQGKAKTVAQIVAIILLLLEGALWVPLQKDALILLTTLRYLGNIAMFIAVVLALTSGYQYVMKNARLFKLKD